MGIVRAIRNARTEYGVEPSRRIEAIIAAREQRGLIASQADVIAALARVDADKLRIEEALEERPRRASALVVGGVEVYLPLAGMVDLERERERLAREMEWVEGEIARAEELLADEEFLAKAPPQVVEKEREKLAGYREKWDKLRERLESLGNRSSP